VAIQAHRAVILDACFLTRRETGRTEVAIAFSWDSNPGGRRNRLSSGK
jgi:hypothetical protein